MRKSICVVTGTRAEYGLLAPLLQRLGSDLEIDLRIVVTGAHLSPEFGSTYKQIELDGFRIHRKIEILLSSDSRCGVNKAIGLGMISFGEYFENHKPDLLIVLGDRYEVFAASSAAAVAAIPIAHIHGGEITEGSTDEFMRHSITKMSLLHFPSTDIYAKRIEQLGEDPGRIFNVGALGVENIYRMSLYSREETERQLGCAAGQPYALVTFHPATLDEEPATAQFSELLSSLSEHPKLRLIFTKANADAGGRKINEMIDCFVSTHSANARSFDSMGQLLYLSAMKYCEVVVGNSSSGIIEAPAFPVPTVDIGDRQKGRVRCPSIINCAPKAAAISAAIDEATSDEYKEGIQGMGNPYGGGDTSLRIYAILKRALAEDTLVRAKRFHDIDGFGN
jgi:GDP/UDP-N,N'-diacetylbacillosamine 2-epimerase (hydrolysing)